MTTSPPSLPSASTVNASPNCQIIRHDAGIEHPLDTRTPRLAFFAGGERHPDRLGQQPTPTDAELPPPS